MPIVTVDISELPKNLRESIRANAVRDEEAKYQMAKVRQTRIAKFFHDHQPRSIDGIGEQTLAIDPFFVGYLQSQGVDFWGDPDVKKWLDKRHAEFRVKSTGTKTQVGYGSCLPPSAPPSGHKKFSKTYPPSTGTDRNHTSVKH